VPPGGYTLSDLTPLQQQQYQFHQQQQQQLRRDGAEANAMRGISPVGSIRVWGSRRLQLEPQPDLSGLSQALIPELVYAGIFASLHTGPSTLNCRH
jgi:hypothetical protein